MNELYEVYQLFGGVNVDKNKLIKVLHEEAMASVRYSIYAEIAESEGLHYYSKIFKETSRNEQSHCKEIMKLLGNIKTTKYNLDTAIENESNEASRIYPDLQKEALGEGELNTARLFQQISKIEKGHKERFEHLRDLLNNEAVFRRDESIIWKCKICGYIHQGNEPPQKCPACQSSYNSFEPEDFSI